MRPVIAILTVVLAACVTAASLAGLLVPAIYSREAPAWAVQGMAQDGVTVVLAVPLLLGSTVLAWQGSRRALLVWAGLLVYLLYTYVLYAFFVHFGPAFPLYLAALSLSFYLLLAVLLHTPLEGLAQAFSPQAPLRATSTLLMVLAVAFFLLWASDVTGALLRGGDPQSVTDAGLPVNPVHVLDMALFLPGMLITGLMLRRRRPLAFFLAPALLVCLVVLGVAVLAMAAVMMRLGAPTPWPLLVAIGLSTTLSLAVLVRLLGTLRG